MRSESCSFIWHPKVRMKYVRVTGAGYASSTGAPAPRRDGRLAAIAPMPTRPTQAVGREPMPGSSASTPTCRPSRCRGPSTAGPASLEGIRLSGGRHGLGLIGEIDVVGRRLGVDARRCRPLADPLGDLDHDLGVLGQERLGVLPTLAELLALVGVPGARLLDDAEVDADVEQRALAADALAVHDVELGLPERRGHLVLHDLDPGAVADDLDAVLDGLDAADVEPDRRVELQRPAAGRGLGRAEHHADLLAQLVDEDADGVRLVEVGGELAQRLGHEPGLEADVGVAHLALDLGPGRERGHRVDHDHVERTRADQHVGDLERLLARVGLGDEQLVDVDPDGPGVDRVHGVLGVDVGADAAVALGLGHHVHGEGGLARGLRAVDLDDPAPGQAADAEGQVEGQRARWGWSRSSSCPSRPSS